MPTNNLPIFPLPIFLLPQGVTQLRIFEARYLKMVSVAMKNNGFVILPYGPQENVNELQTGCWVEIINFDQNEAGLLLIDVRCKCLVDIRTVTQDNNKLHHGDVSAKDHWPDICLDKTTDKLAKSLSKFFSDNDELNHLYPKKALGQGQWVVARWLELLPIKLEEKRLFFEQDAFCQAKQVVQSIILPEEET